MSRLRCESENRICCGRERHMDRSVTRCKRCGKATCSACEGSDNGFRDICDRCWCVLDFYVKRLVWAGDAAGARIVLRKWARRPWPGEVNRPRGREFNYDTGPRGTTTPYALLCNEYGAEAA